MLKAAELLRQGRTQELWDMCCGYLRLSLDEFMAVQRRLMAEQLERLNGCELGLRIMGGRRPQTVDEFRRTVPLTTYQDYGEDFMRHREDILPVKPAFWVRTSGRTGDFSFKWVPMAPEYAEQLSAVLFGVGIISSARDWGDVQVPEDINILYSVAPRPYISGTFADLLRLQSPINYLPELEQAEAMEFTERLHVGFEQAAWRGLDYFFGLSLVLVMVGEKIRDSSSHVDLRPYLKHPRALLRLGRAFVKSRLEGRHTLLPRDLWKVRGIIGSGVDSWVYKQKIEELWGRKPLDLYSSTEGGVIACQTWDYGGMTPVPNLNFLEFIPEDELLKEEMDSSYRVKTLLLDEVEAGESYEMVLTNFHGGAMVRYRIGDMIRITALRNDSLGIGLPQMTFQRRADELISFMVIKLTEKQIWQAIEKSGVPYEDWAAYKVPGEGVLHVLLETKEGCESTAEQICQVLEAQLVDAGRDSYTESGVQEDWRNGLDFSVDVTLLPHGTFEGYTAMKQAEGADPAHLKPPHISPPEHALAFLLKDVEELVVVRKNAAGSPVAGSADEEHVTA